MLDSTAAVDTATASNRGNSTTKAALLNRAKNAIEAGHQSLHDAAEALALAQQDFKASQREITDAVGKSVAWVNRLLQWQRQGCVGTPFGPGSKARRERQKSVQAPEQQSPHRNDVDNAEASIERRKTECAKRHAEPKSQEQRALVEFRYAVDHWIPQMDDATKRKAIEYAIAKSKVRASCAIDK
jgi:hypothetical protein